MPSLTNFKNIVNGISLVPNASAPTPANQRLGDLYAIGSSTNTLNFHNGTSASQVLTAAHSADVTNKNLVGSTVRFVDSSTNPKALVVDTSTMPSSSTTATFRFLNAANRAYTFPNALTDQVVVLEGFQQTLTNKTLTSPVLNTSSADSITAIAGSNLTLTGATGQNVIVNTQSSQNIQLQVAGSPRATISTSGLDLSSGSTLKLVNTGTITVGAATGSASYSFTFPAAAPVANTFLRYDGTNYTWTVPVSNILTNGVLATSSNTTLNRVTDSGKLVTVNTSSASYSITLPASPQLGDNYVIKDINGALNFNPLTINPNGVTLEGSTSNYVVYAPFWSKMIFYTGSSYILL